MDNNLQDVYNSPQAQPAVIRKAPMWLIVTTIICAVLAAAGIALGVYGLMDSSQKSGQITDLETTIDEKDTKITELEAAIAEAEADDEDTAGGVLTLILGDEISASETTTVFKLGECSADGAGDSSYIKCPVVTNEGEALVSYHYNDGILRLSLNNE